MDKAISLIADAKQVAPNKPFFMYFAPAPCMRRTMCQRSGRTNTRASSTTAGMPTARRSLQRQKELGIIPQDAELSRHDPDVQEWDTLSADEKKLYARMMEVFAGFLEHTDYHIRPTCSSS